MANKRSRLDRTVVRLRQFKYNLKQSLFVEHKYLLLVVPIIMILLFVGSVSSLLRNWELQQTIASKKAELEYTKLEVDNLELENQYLASDEYQELIARKLMNKKLEGETMIYLPKNSEYAKNKYANDVSVAVVKANNKTNLDLWLSFLFGI